MTPLFTIAVTTYNRKEMLRQCLASIFAQEFSDYEVIVGNNYTEEVLTEELLEISDERLRIINHQHDLGQLGNMNYLLAQARGRYFSWLADDDMLAPQCLIALSTSLLQFAYPKCVFCSYTDGSEYTPEPVKNITEHSQLINGAIFLEQYLSRQLKLIGCYGGFDTRYLTEHGGIRTLGSKFSPYADNLIAIEAGMLDAVVYIDQPLFFFRTHNQSLSYTSGELDAYTSAQLDLLSICEAIFKNKKLARGYRRNMYHLLAWCAGDIFSVACRSAALIPDGLGNHLIVLQRYARRTGWLYAKFLLLNIWLAVSYLKNGVFLKRGRYEATDS